MAFRISTTLIVLSVFTAGMIGCSDSSPSPAGSSGTSGANETTTADPAPEETAGVGDEQAPEGNSEPPLADVTDAVDSLPTAGTSEVTLTTVTPQEFEAVVAKHKGKVVFVDFWATWCVPCRTAFPKTVQLAAKHPDDLVVISMSFDDPDSHSDALEFLTEQKATFENLMCKHGGGDESFAAYNIESGGLPYFRVYDRDSKLAQVFEIDVDAGKGIDEADVHHAIEALIAGK